MGFSLTNAPSMFQALMNEVLSTYLLKCVLVFFDNILIYSRSLFEHLRHVRMVFLKQSKCSFTERSVACLGYINH